MLAFMNMEDSLFLGILESLSQSSARSKQHPVQGRKPTKKEKNTLIVGSMASSLANPNKCLCSPQSTWRPHMLSIKSRATYVSVNNRLYIQQWYTIQLKSVVGYTIQVYVSMIATTKSPNDVFLRTIPVVKQHMTILYIVLYWSVLDSQVYAYLHMRLHQKSSLQLE